MEYEIIIDIEGWTDPRQTKIIRDDKDDRIEDICIICHFVQSLLIY